MGNPPKAHRCVPAGKVPALPGEHPSRACILDKIGSVIPTLTIYYTGVMRIDSPAGDERLFPFSPRIAGCLRPRGDAHECG